MKRFVVIAVALLAFWGAAAQQPSTMKFTADEWDFGTIKEEGGKVFRIYEQRPQSVRNPEGRDLLRLHDADFHARAGVARA